MGPPGPPFRGPPLAGRAALGRDPYSGQPEFEGSRPSGQLPGRPSAGRGSDWPPRSNGYLVKSPRDVLQSSVMNRLGPHATQDRRNPASDLDMAPQVAAATPSDVSLSNAGSD